VIGSLIGSKRGELWLERNPLAKELEAFKARDPDGFKYSALFNYLKDPKNFTKVIVENRTLQSVSYVIYYRI